MANRSQRAPQPSTNADTLKLALNQMPGCTVPLMTMRFHCIQLRP